jgi:diaminopimelate decarboxylase
MGRKAPVGIRVNPDVDPKTHPYISTGLKKNKFGIGAHEAMDAYRAADRLANVEVIGIDCHIGSQITDPSPFEDAMKNIAALVTSLQEIGIGIRFVDVGGGLGITYRDESPPGLTDYARAITGAFKGMGVSLILEPGRVLVGNAGILVTRVLYRKPGPEKSFIIVDAGMNDLLRPSLYDAYHEVVPVASGHSETPIQADVVGPICETGDFLARDRAIADVPSGGLLAVMSAGAYGFSMSSNYCSRLRIPEVMVKGDAYAITRMRETYAQLTNGESLPDFST